jgi:hypothetical protein
MVPELYPVAQVLFITAAERRIVVITVPVMGSIVWAEPADFHKRVFYTFHLSTLVYIFLPAPFFVYGQSNQNLGYSYHDWINR